MVYNNNGYVKLHRKLFEWEWWDDINTFRLFVTILLMANWKPKKWRGRVIPRGSCWTSLRELSKKSGLTYQQTRTALDKLISTGEITDKVTHRGRLVTVVNYDVYQSDNENVTDKLTDKNADNQQTSNTQVNRQVTTTEEHIRKQEYKELKELQQESGRFTEIDINEILSVEDIAALGKRYERVNDLLDEVEADINAKGKSVRYPFRYVNGYARNKEWPRKKTEPQRKEAE